MQRDRQTVFAKIVFLRFDIGADETDVAEEMLQHLIGYGFDSGPIPKRRSTFTRKLCHHYPTVCIDVLYPIRA